MKKRAENLCGLIRRARRIVALELHRREVLHDHLGLFGQALCQEFYQLRSALDLSPNEIKRHFDRANFRQSDRGMRIRRNTRKSVFTTDLIVAENADLDRLLLPRELKTDLAALNEKEARGFLALTIEDFAFFESLDGAHASYIDV